MLKELTLRVGMLTNSVDDPAEFPKLRVVNANIRDVVAEVTTSSIVLYETLVTVLLDLSVMWPGPKELLSCKRGHSFGPSFTNLVTVVVKMEFEAPVFIRSTYNVDVVKHAAVLVIVTCSHLVATGEASFAPALGAGW